MAHDSSPVEASLTATMCTAIRSILDLAPSKFRSPILGNPDGSRRQWIFNDALGKYEPLAYVPVEKIEVSSLESFCELVDERLTPGDGTGAVVIFNQRGATFAKSKESIDSYAYARRLHPTWEAVVQSLGKNYDHPGFLRFLHSISDTVKDYEDVMRSFKRVIFNKNATVSSAPMLDDDGGAHLSYKLEMMARDGKSSARLPGVLTLGVPFTPTGEGYVLNLELDITLQGDQLRFTMFAPNLPSQTLRALRDEPAAFDYVQKNHPKMLVLEDF